MFPEVIIVGILVISLVLLYISIAARSRKKDAEEWPFCTTPGCKNRQCLWSGVPFCYPCAEKAIGSDNMRLIYEITHPKEESGEDVGGTEEQK